MPDQSYRVPIIVAVIGVLGTLGAALIANWDKLFGHATQAAVPTASIAASPLTPVAPVVVTSSLAGTWIDAVNPGIISTIAQEGNALRFTRIGSLPNGVAFESNGTGTVSGQQVSTQYVAKYQTGITSSGQCAGSVLEQATTIDLRCTDSLLGSFQSTSVRR